MTRQELCAELSDALREYGEAGITGIGRYGLRVMQLHVALVGELAQECDGQGPHEGGMTSISEHEKQIVEGLQDLLLHSDVQQAGAVEPIVSALELLAAYQRRLAEVLGALGGVTIAIHGESDDLVEVSGPCWDSGKLRGVGEYGAFDADNQEFLVVGSDLTVLARVYASYLSSVGWMFALANPTYEERPMGDDIRGVTTACADCDYSTLLTVHAPEGAFFTTREGLQELVAQRAVEGIEE
jgi:hypothetical protein